MSSAQVFYIINLLIYAGVDIIACLGLSQQFGVAGVTNFGFIIFQAAGAYTAAILSLPRQSANGGFQSYIGGWNLPFPVPWIGAAIAGGLVALPFTFLVGRRLRGDFAAVGLLITAVMANLLVTNYRPFLNGAAGLSLVPAPLQGEYNPQSQGYQWDYTVVTLVLAAAAFLLVRRVTESPYGRSLRAMRDNDLVADSLGKNLLSMRAAVLVLGGALAGLSGAILVGFINLWAPSAWGYAETIVLFAAVIIGGAGNHRGAVLGAILVPVGFEEATRYIHGPPGLVDDLQWVAIGLLIVVFLWLRPQGVLPERRRLAAPRIDITERSVVAPLVPTAQAEVVLRAAGVSRDFGSVRAVEDVSIEVRRGTLTGLIGPNGAGKSTLLAMLAGTLPVTSGQIGYLGGDVTGLPAFRRARLGLVRTFQLASEFKRLTVMENLLSAVPRNRGDSLRGALLGRRYWRGDETAAAERAWKLLEQFGLAAYADTYAGDLSGGQRRLVEIMRALMAEPRVLLLDEPLAGVHPHLAHQIGERLLGLCAEGMTILMVEHELAIMDEFCDPVIVMAEGRVLAEGTMAELRARAEVVEAYLVG
ncbi:MAG: branched-chain amino acid ABC transporter ATP-binding protein/permease [Streptosporangiaceae bacterium]|nr:branched-chain amino acid ABC transporter ATP-binding protein/permease [Streptosporangiaceae bacterium]